MRLDFDEFSFQDEVNFMNLNDQMQRTGKMNFNSTIGFNNDTIYQKIEEK